MKIDRLKVYQKYNGKCAYCGCDIEFKKMQVDHFYPQHLTRPIEFEINHGSNLMPSCQKCNNHKSGMTIEMWRKELERHSDMLLKSAQFLRAVKFGQVVITKKPIVFYYEDHR